MNTDITSKPTALAVYYGTRLLGEIEDHGGGDVRAFQLTESDAWPSAPIPTAKRPREPSVTPPRRRRRRRPNDLGSHQRTTGASQVLVVQCRDCGKAEQFEGDLLNSVRAMEASGRWLVGDDGFCRCEEHSAVSDAAEAAAEVDGGSE
jgi:hypothetical protein